LLTSITKLSYHQFTEIHNTEMLTLSDISRTSNYWYYKW